MAGIGTGVQFIAGFGPIDRNIAESRALYADTLGILFKEDAGGYRQPISLIRGSVGRRNLHPFAAWAETI